jgi:EAL domain-containing protein (putative c-di-GMP-specific phosphodiesterase class I)
MDADPETHEIVRIIVMLAHGLRLKVVAEGVETQAQADMLKDIGCELAQGYLYSRPVAAEAIEQLLRDNRAGSISSTRAKAATSTSA